MLYYYNIFHLGLDFYFKYWILFNVESILNYNCFIGFQEYLKDYKMLREFYIYLFLYIYVPRLIKGEVSSWYLSCVAGQDSRLRL